MSKQNQIIIFTIVILVAAVEAAGYIVKQRNRVPNVETMIPDVILNHKFAPNLKHIDKARGIPNPIFTNDQSWAEHESIPLNKAAGSYRIFYVGDSTTHGVVEEGKRLPDIVERELNAIYRPKGVRFEVVNTGTSSYSTMIYYLLIKNEILKYAPDLIVINVDMTDIPNDVGYRKLARYDENGLPLAIAPADETQKLRYRLTPHGEVKIPAWRHYQIQAHIFLVNNSLIVRSLEKAILPTLKKMAILIYGSKEAAPQRKSNDDISGDWLAQEWDEKIQNNVDYSMRVLSETIKLLKAKGVRIIVTGVPHYPQYTGEWSIKPHQVLKETAAKSDAKYLDSYAALKDKIAGTGVEAYYWRVDPTHFNEAGNTIWAKAQLEFLLDSKNGLLPPR